MPPRRAFATPLGDAQRAMAEAKNQFYETIYAHPEMTGPERTKLYNDLVMPARNRMADAFNKTLQNVDHQMFDESRRKIEELHRKGRLKSKGGSDSGGGKKGGSRVQPDTAPARPEVVLDGAGIPKEVEFKGKKGSKPRPKPLVSPSPVATVQPAPAPVASGGVGELNFPGASVKPAPVPSKPAQLQNGKKAIQKTSKSGGK